MLAPQAKAREGLCLLSGGCEGGGCCAAAKPWAAKRGERREGWEAGPARRIDRGWRRAAFALWRREEERPGLWGRRPPPFTRLAAG